MKELILFNIRKRFHNRITVLVNVLLFIMCAIVVNMDLIIKDTSPSIIYLDSTMEKYRASFEEISHDEYSYLMSEEGEEGITLCCKGDYILISDVRISNEMMQKIKDDIVSVLVSEHCYDAKNCLNITVQQINTETSSENVVWAILSIAYLLITAFGSSVGSSIVCEKNTHTLELVLTNTDAKSHLLAKIISAYIIPAIQLVLVFVMILIHIIIRFFTNGLPSLSGLIEKTGIEKYNAIITIEPLRILAIILIFVSSLVLIQVLLLIIMSGITNLDENAALQSIIGVGIMLIYCALMFLCKEEFFMSAFGRILSFFPILSPFIMCCRIAIKNAGIIDVAICLIINILTLMALFKWMLPVYRENLFSSRK